MEDSLTQNEEKDLQAANMSSIEFLALQSSFF